MLSSLSVTVPNPIQMLLTGAPFVICACTVLDAGLGGVETPGGVSPPTADLASQNTSRDGKATSHDILRRWEAWRQ